MTMANNFSQKKGRTTEDKYLQLRGQAFQMIWEKWREGSLGSHINYEEAEKILS